MIYQCYFRPSQSKEFFNSHAYQPFGLEPNVNDRLLEGCPELETPKNRIQLLDMAAMLWWYRHLDETPDEWIGFTSWRQYTKTRTYFKSKEVVESLLSSHDVLSWGYHIFNQSLADRSERSHPGINVFMKALFEIVGEEIPDDYYKRTDGPLVDYWAMSKENFVEFMEYMLPFQEYCLNNLDRYWYLQNHPKSSAYVLERLFPIWVMKKGMHVRVIDPVVPNKFNIKFQSIYYSTDPRSTKFLTSPDVDYLEHTNHNDEFAGQLYTHSNASERMVAG